MNCKKYLCLNLGLSALLLCASSLSFALGEKTYLNASAKAGDLILADANSTATLYVDTQDYPGVQRAAKNLQGDIEKVTAKKPALNQTAGDLKNQVVIIGTIGHNALID
jgi:hypothetical protein